MELALCNVYVDKIKTNEIDFNYKVNNPYMVCKSLNDTIKLSKQTQEVFGMITVNKRINTLGLFEINRGTVDKCTVDLRDIFQRAFLTNATAIIVFHNHPSGNLTPSKQDIELTQKIKEGCKLVGLQLLDHLIIAPDDNYSFKENNKL